MRALAFLALFGGAAATSQRISIYKVTTGTIPIPASLGITSTDSFVVPAAPFEGRWDPFGTNKTTDLFYTAMRTDMPAGWETEGWVVSDINITCAIAVNGDGIVPYIIGAYRGVDGANGTDSHFTVNPLPNTKEPGWVSPVFNIIVSESHGAWTNMSWSWNDDTPWAMDPAVFDTGNFVIAHALRFISGTATYAIIDECGGHILIERTTTTGAQQTTSLVHTTGMDTSTGQQVSTGTPKETTGVIQGTTGIIQMATATPNIPNIVPDPPVVGDDIRSSEGTTQLFIYITWGVVLAITSIICIALVFVGMSRFSGRAWVNGRAAAISDLSNDESGSANEFADILIPKTKEVANVDSIYNMICMESPMNDVPLDEDNDHGSGVYRASSPEIMEGITIERKIGEGNFGTVYMGRIATGGNVAIKSMVGSDHGDITEEILREQSIAAKCNHPCIVKTYGMTRISHGYGIVMEYMDGGTLLAYLRSGANPPITMLAKIFYSVCSAMKHMASHNVVHGDLAARNVLMSKDMKHVKVCDFGQSIPLAGGKKYARLPTSVPVRWSAPEVLSEFKFSEKSDVYAAGILIGELFSHGTQPLANLDTNAKVIDHIKMGGSPNPPGMLPPEFASLYAVCTERDPSSRPDFDVVGKITMRIIDDISTSADGSFYEMVSAGSERGRSRSFSAPYGSEESDYETGRARRTAGDEPLPGDTVQFPNGNYASFDGQCSTTSSEAEVIYNAH